jgi:hypothetical protein
VPYGRLTLLIHVNATVRPVRAVRSAHPFRVRWSSGPPSTKSQRERTRVSFRRVSTVDTMTGDALLIIDMQAGMLAEGPDAASRHHVRLSGAATLARW